MRRPHECACKDCQKLHDLGLMRAFYKQGMRLAQPVSRVQLCQPSTQQHVSGGTRRACCDPISHKAHLARLLTRRGGGWLLTLPQPVAVGPDPPASAGRLLSPRPLQSHAAAPQRWGAAALTGGQPRRPETAGRPSRVQSKAAAAEWEPARTGTMQPGQ
jgi:hypothetical protein